MMTNNIRSFTCFFPSFLEKTRTVTPFKICSYLTFNELQDCQSTYSFHLTFEVPSFNFTFSLWALFLLIIDFMVYHGLSHISTHCLKWADRFHIRHAQLVLITSHSMTFCVLKVHFSLKLSISTEQVPNSTNECLVQSKMWRYKAGKYVNTCIYDEGKSSLGHSLNIIHSSL